MDFEEYLNDDTLCTESEIELYTDEFIEACESFMNDLELELAIEAAMESEGEDTSKSASGLASKVRGAFSKLKRGDKKAKKEIEDAAVEFEELEDLADTPEDKKKISTAGKVALTALATTAAAAGLYAIANHARKSAKGNPDGKVVSKILLKYADGVDKIVDIPKDIKLKHDQKVAMKNGDPIPAKYKVADEAAMLIEACESFMNDLEIELAMDIAFEAAGESNNISADVSDAVTKIRNGATKARKGDKNGLKEVKEAAKELSEAEKAAETPEEKSKVSKAVKIGLAALATTAAAVGAVALAKKLRASAQAKREAKVAAIINLVNNFSPNDFEPVQFNPRTFNKKDFRPKDFDPWNP